MLVPEDKPEPDPGVEATVVDLLPQGKFRLELDNKDQVLAHSAGVPVLNYMRIRPGDKVRVQLSPHDRTRGRIVKLLKK